MLDYKADIDDFLKKSIHCPTIDVRSPAEFERGHIPGAVNVSLLTNEERSAVGTLYLQKGSNAAMKKGLEYVGPKMKEFVERAYDLASNGETGIYCWRGGMRSNSMAWLLNTAGIKSHTLNGGYKAYRRYVHEYFSRPHNMIVIGGMTGSGKTEILEEIERSGGQVVHLEKLAAHKGSVFGHLGMPGQPTTEQFENDLFTCLLSIDPRRPFFVEDESLVIGRIFIPRPFYIQMSSARFVNLVVPFDQRVNRLVGTYAASEKDLLAAGIRKIEKRLGRENSLRTIELIHEGNMKKAVELVLYYYDKLYRRSMDLHNRQNKDDIIVTYQNIKEIAKTIIGRQYQTS